MNDRQSRPSAVSILSVFCVGTAGVLITALKPAVLSSYVSHAGIGEVVAGYLVSVQIMAAFLGTLIISLRGHIWNRRHAVMVGLLLLLVGNLLTASLRGPWPLGGARFVAGLGEGLTVGLFAATLAGYPKAERLFGVSTVISLLVAAGAYQLVPGLLAWKGIAGLFLFLCCPVLLALMVVPVFPSRPAASVTKVAAEKGSSAALPMGAVVLGAGTIAYYLSVGGIWPYMGQIGISSELSPAAVASIFGYSQIWGVAAAISPIILGDRFGKALPMAVAIILGIICLLLLLGLPGQPQIFALVAQAFIFGWLMFFPYLMGLTSTLDPLGRLASFVYTAQAIGFFVGPALCAQAIRIGSYDAMLWFGVACFAITLCVLLPIAIKQDRRWAT